MADADFHVIIDNIIYAQKYNSQFRLYKHLK